MNLDLKSLTIEDFEYAESWMKLLPFADNEHRRTTIAQIHKNVVDMTDDKGVSLFVNQAEVRIACTAVIIHSNILNDIRVSAIIYDYLLTMGIDVEGMTDVILSRLNKSSESRRNLPSYVVTSPLSKFKTITESMIGDRTIIGYGSGQEAETFISVNRPPSVILIGDVGSRTPSYLIPDYNLWYRGSVFPKADDYGITTYVLKDVFDEIDDDDGFVYDPTDI